MAQIRGYTGRIGGTMDVALYNVRKAGAAALVLEAIDSDGSNNNTFVCIQSFSDGVAYQRTLTPTEFIQEFNPERRTG